MRMKRKYKNLKKTSQKATRVMIMNSLKKAKAHSRKVRIPHKNKKTINNKKINKHHLAILRKMRKKKRQQRRTNKPTNPL